MRLDAEGTAGEQSRLKALWVLGYVAVLQGDTVHALAALQECRREAERSANATAVAYAEHRTGCLALVTDDMPRAETLLRSALHRYREIGELNSNVLMGQVELAMARAFQGDLPDAVRLCEDVRRVCEDHGERWARGYALYVLAYAAWYDGEPVRARELLADCLRGAHRFRDQLGSVLAVELLALVTVAEGDARRRRRCCRAGRPGCGRRWGCRCSARRTTTRRTSCARRPRGSSWATSATRSASGTGRGWAAGRW